MVAAGLIGLESFSPNRLHGNKVNIRSTVGDNGVCRNPDNKMTPSGSSPW